MRPQCQQPSLTIAFMPAAGFLSIANYPTAARRRGRFSTMCSVPSSMRCPSRIQGEWDLKTPVEAVEALKERAGTIHIMPNMAHNSSIDGGDVLFWERAIIEAHLSDKPITLEHRTVNLTRTLLP